MRPALAHHRDLHVHLDLERLLQPADLPHRPATTPCRSALRLFIGLERRPVRVRADVRHVAALPGAGPGFFLAFQRYLVQGMATQGFK